MPAVLNIALNYAVALIETGGSSDFEQAVKIITRLDKRYPGSTKIMNQLTYPALSQQNFPGVAVWFKRIMPQLPANDPRSEFIHAMLKTLEQSPAALWLLCHWRCQALPDQGLLR